MAEPRLVSIHDRQALADHLGQDPLLQVYLLGDLDPFFWPSTSWYGLESDGELEVVLLVYAGPRIPAVLLTCPEDRLPAARALLEAAGPLLPARFHGHLSQGCESGLECSHRLRRSGHFLRMALTRPEALTDVDTANVAPLGGTHLDELRALYAEAYPGNWFDSRMLETRYYFGARHEGSLAAVAGVHVVCAEHGVAALGNITTAPALRRRGLGTSVTAQVCKALLEAVPRVCLNVNENNEAARRCYERLGFEVVARYDEHVAEPA